MGNACSPTGFLTWMMGCGWQVDNFVLPYGNKSKAEKSKYPGSRAVEGSMASDSVGHKKQFTISRYILAERVLTRGFEVPYRVGLIEMPPDS